MRPERRRRTDRRGAARQAWKANRPGPLSCEAVARRLAQELRDAGRGPVHLPQVYALILLGWIRNYEARVTDVLDEVARWGPDARERLGATLQSVLDPHLLERPLDLPALERPRRAPLPPPPEYRLHPGDLEPEPYPPPPPLPPALERLLDGIDEDDRL